MRIVPLDIPADTADSVRDGWNTYRGRDFTGGENRQILPELLKPNQLLLAFNMVMNGEGTVETRTGKTNIFTDVILSGTITSVHRYAKEDGTNYVVLQNGANLYAAVYNSGTLSTITTITGTFNAAKFRSKVWKDKLFLTNGVDAVQVFDGTNIAAIGGTTIKSEIIAIYAGRIWLIDKARPNVLVPSRLEDYTTAFDALEEIKLRDGDGDVITGLSPQDGGMVIFKSKSTWVLYGTNRDNYRIPEAPLSPTTGCVATDSILDDGLFAGYDNIYRFSLTTVEPVSDTHRSVIESMSLAEKKAIFAIADPVKRRALVHIGTQILCLDARYGGITSWDNLSAQCFACMDAEGDDGSILVGDATNGFIYKLDTANSDDGVAIQCLMQTAYLDHNMTRKKVWGTFTPEVESLGAITSELRYSFDVDYGSVEDLYTIPVLNTGGGGLTWDLSQWDEAVWDETLRVTEIFWLHTAMGNRISFKIASTDRIKFLGFTTKYREVGP
jgi:hypothetical protein